MWATTSSGNKIYIPKKLNKNEEDFISAFSNLNLETNYSVVSIPKDNFSSINYITTTNLDFYKVWCLFTSMPTIINNSYVYTIKDVSTSTYFFLKAEKKCKFVNIKTYEIFSTSDDKYINTEFLKHLENALRLYNKEYIHIEKHIFTSDKQEIAEHLKFIMNELFKHKDLLKSF